MVADQRRHHPDRDGGRQEGPVPGLAQPRRPDPAGRSSGSPCGSPPARRPTTSTSSSTPRPSRRRAPRTLGPRTTHRARRRSGGSPSPPTRSCSSSRCARGSCGARTPRRARSRRPRTRPRRLGWKVTKFNRKLDNVCQKLADAGTRGLHGGPGKLASNRKARLVEHALSTRLVTEGDLALLDAPGPRGRPDATPA